MKLKLGTHGATWQVAHDGQTDKEMYIFRGEKHESVNNSGVWVSRSRNSLITGEFTNSVYLEVRAEGHSVAGYFTAERAREIALNLLFVAAAAEADNA